MIEPMRKHTRRADSGFTLIEMLVAVVLMGLVLAALGVITAQWLPNWSRGFKRVQGGERVSITLDRIVSDLGAAEFLIQTVTTSFHCSRATNAVSPSSAAPTDSMRDAVSKS